MFEYPVLEQRSLALVEERIGTHQYEWYSQGNRQNFLEEVAAIEVGFEHSLSYQIDFHLLTAIGLYYKDHVERVHDYIQVETTYNGWYYHADNKPILDRPFDGSLFRQDYTWAILDEVKRIRSIQGLHFSPLAQYKEVIPAQILLLINTVKQLEYQPDRYWVVTPRLNQSAPSLNQSVRRAVDPWLLVSYGNWFVSIGEWV